jgi:hypothetical protein
LGSLNVQVLVCLLNRSELQTLDSGGCSTGGKKFNTTRFPITRQFELTLGVFPYIVRCGHAINTRRKTSSRNLNRRGGTDQSRTSPIGRNACFCLGTSRCVRKKALLCCTTQATLPWTEPMRRRDLIVYESKSVVVGSFACGNHWRSARALRRFSAYWEHDGRRFGGRLCKCLKGIRRYFRPGRNNASAAPVRS